MTPDGLRELVAAATEKPRYGGRTLAEAGAYFWLRDNGPELATLLADAMEWIQNSPSSIGAAHLGSAMKLMERLDKLGSGQ